MRTRARSSIKHAGKGRGGRIDLHGGRRGAPVAARGRPGRHRGGRGGVRYALVVWARVAGDPVGPSTRALPDLPGGELTDGVVQLHPLWTEDAPDVYALQSLPEVVAAGVPPEPPDPEAVRLRCAE